MASHNVAAVWKRGWLPKCAAFTSRGRDEGSLVLALALALALALLLATEYLLPAANAVKAAGEPEYRSKILALRWRFEAFEPICKTNSKPNIRKRQ
jgi:hypothetical protein